MEQLYDGRWVAKIGELFLSSGSCCTEIDAIHEFGYYGLDEMVQELYARRGVLEHEYSNDITRIRPGLAHFRHRLVLKSLLTEELWLSGSWVLDTEEAALEHWRAVASTHGRSANPSGIAEVFEVQKTKILFRTVNVDRVSR